MSLPAYEIAGERLKEEGLRALILNAQPEKGLPCLPPSRTELIQSDRVMANKLSRLPFKLNAPLTPPYDVAVVFPCKHRTQTLAMIGEAWLHLREKGCLILSIPNRLGAKGYEKRLRECFKDALSSYCKGKGRTLIIQRISSHEPLLRAWAKAGEIQWVASIGFWSKPGLFSWNRIDPASRLLCESLGELKGRGMDLGCGYGFITHYCLKHSQSIHRVHLVDASLDAIACAKKNLAWTDKCAFHWLDASSEPLPDGLDWVVTNPPFHQGIKTDVSLGQTILVRAIQSLRKGGCLYAVANRHLPYEPVLNRSAGKVECIAKSDAFKVLRVFR